MFAGLYRLVQSRLGHLCQSLRQNEELASSIGINVASLRVLAFAFSSFLGGIGGAFFAAISQNIYPASYTVTNSINFMLYCFLGGLDYVLGPDGRRLPPLFRLGLPLPLRQYQPLIYSILMIAVMLVLPNGMLSLGSLGRRSESPMSAVILRSRPDQALRRARRGQRRHLRRRGAARSSR